MPTRYWQVRTKSEHGGDRPKGIGADQIIGDLQGHPNEHLHNSSGWHKLPPFAPVTESSHIDTPYALISEPGQLIFDWTGYCCA